MYRVPQAPRENCILLGQKMNLAPKDKQIVSRDTILHYPTNDATRQQLKCASCRYYYNVSLFMPTPEDEDNNRSKPQGNGTYASCRGCREQSRFSYKKKRLEKLMLEVSEICELNGQLIEDLKMYTNFIVNKPYGK